MSEQEIVVFTDGASKGNPGPGGWGAVVIRPGGTVRELGGGAAQTTNNKMELTGAIEAFSEIAREPGRVSVYTDSTYVIQGIRDWIHSWKRRGWKTATGGDVMNQELWQALSELTGARGPRNISWHYVRGHVGTPGNERCDTIADAFATGKPVELYDGPRAGYTVDVHVLPDDTSVPARSAASGASKSKGAAYSYLSVVGGKPMRHKTWAECEQRVKGVAGARFKKAMSATDEVEILRGWRVNPSDL
ncbi:MAG: ribonuclease HI [Vicinamibacterales bacterium]